MLHLAAYKHGDILNKDIIDLGCGTGRLGLGSAIIGAKSVLGVDIDSRVVEIAAKAARKLQVKEKTQWLTADITSIRGTFDTVLQNPPFGVQRKKADRSFLEKALEIGIRIYSLHKSVDAEDNLFSQKSRRGMREVRLKPAPVAPFLKRFVERQGGRVEASYIIPMTIPHLFSFHRKPSRQILANLIVVESGRASLSK
jgi:putative methylase